MRHCYIFKCQLGIRRNLFLFRAKLLMNVARSRTSRGTENCDPSARETASRLKELRFYLSDDISVLTVYNCGVLCRRKM